MGQENTQKIKHLNPFMLLFKRKFGPFFWAQFFGAFNDNLYKNALIILITYEGMKWTTAQPGMLVNIFSALFIFPFFIFSSIAGQIADKSEKSGLIKNIKLFEIGITFVAVSGFYFHSFNCLVVALVLLGVQAAFFGPVKYSILPQHLTKDQLMGGNGMAEMGTFIAILLGSILGGLLIVIENFGELYLCIGTVLCAFIGYFSSLFIPKAPATNPSLVINYNIFSSTIQNLKNSREIKSVFLALLGISWFWFYGAVFLAQLPTFAKYLGATAHVVTVFLAMFSLGAGVGAVLSDRLSRGKIELGLVPFGTIGLSLFAVDIYFACPTAAQSAIFDVVQFIHTSYGLRIFIDLFLIGVFSGIFTVPLYAFIQSRTPLKNVSQIIAANNILNALFMVISAIFCVILIHFKFTVIDIFLATALLNALVCSFIYYLMPEFLLRFLIWILMGFLYRIQVKGRENIPDEGPALIICNHVSFMDALILAAKCKRPLRFVMDYRISKIPFIKQICQDAKVIPIAPMSDFPGQKEKAFVPVSDALKNGDLVAIFPEGGLTKNGELMRFRREVEYILKENSVPIIPMAISGMWGSLFSRHKNGKAFQNLPRFFARIYLNVGKPIYQENIDANTLQSIVKELRGNIK